MHIYAFYNDFNTPLNIFQTAVVYEMAASICVCDILLM